MTMREEQPSPALERIHDRIDTVCTTLSELLDAMTYDRKSNRPGILPRLDNVEKAQTEQTAALRAHMEKEAKQQLRTWLYEMGTYVIKVMLAAFALYIAAAAKQGIIIDLLKDAKTSVVEQFDPEALDCIEAGTCDLASRQPKLPRSPN